MIENLLRIQNVNPLWVKLDGDTRWKARWNFSIPITSFLYLSPMLKGETSERKRQIADIFSLDKSYKLAFHVLDTFTVSVISVENILARLRERSPWAGRVTTSTELLAWVLHWSCCSELELVLRRGLSENLHQWWQNFKSSCRNY